MEPIAKVIGYFFSEFPAIKHIFVANLSKSVRAGSVLAFDIYDMIHGLSRAFNS